MNLINISERLLKLLFSKQITIKNIGDRGRFSTILVLNNSHFTRPELLQDDKGETIVLQNDLRYEKIKLKILGNGLLKICLQTTQHTECQISKE